MSTMNAAIAQYGKSSRKRGLRGIAVALVFHIAAGWALLSGTASQGVAHLRDTMQAAIIQEVIIPPAPKEPAKAEPVRTAKIERLKTTPKPRPAAAPFVPRSELAAPADAAPAIESVEAPPAKAEPVAFTEKSAAKISLAVAPAPSPAPVREPVQRTEIGVACPTQVQPEMPRKALLEGIEGVVKAQALINDGTVREVKILSGPRIFHEAVRNAMLQYRCTHDGSQVIAVQAFNFTIQ